ncbi:hypothetical protein OH77DRAFT_893160 [Trametes cingulata]|nr:hypothetical protein OH77DRAFT_893160 [Trametes cingulata]
MVPASPAHSRWRLACARGTRPGAPTYISIAPPQERVHSPQASNSRSTRPCVYTISVQRLLNHPTVALLCRHASETSACAPAPCLPHHVRIEPSEPRATGQSYHVGSGVTYESTALRVDLPSGSPPFVPVTFVILLYIYPSIHSISSGSIRT